MAAEVRNFVATLSTGTTATAPQTIDLAMPPRIVRAVRWRVPEGHYGQTGWALAVGGQVIIPWNMGGWIVADNEWDDIPLDGQIDSGAWQLIGYNLGSYPHSVYLTFQLDPVTLTDTSATSGPLAIVSA